MQPYGTWISPINAESVASSIISFQDLVIDNDTIYWSEMRPAEKGRYVIVMQAPLKKAEDVLPLSFNARTRVHEYGGAAFTVHQGTIYFTNYEDQRLYSFKKGEVPIPLTAPGIRFAELKITPFGIVAIAESHLKEGEPENFLALIDLATGEVTSLANGHDFYSSPALNKECNKIAWICWNHPNMPWDNTELWIADIQDKKLKNSYRVEEAYVEQAFFQPGWGADDELLVVSDKSNWWNLYKVKGQQLIPLFNVASELGAPLWNLGKSLWGFYDEGVLAAYVAPEKGICQLHFYKDGRINTIDAPYTQFSQVIIKDKLIACIAGAADKSTAVILKAGDNSFKILKENTKLEVNDQYLSIPQHITFPSKNGRVAHAYYYPPHNIDYEKDKKALPPLIVKSHGGPTANCGCNFNLEIQYWTSRGYAVVDVNYGGSSGYGRAYRDALKQQWGIVDVEDCEAAALYLVKEGKASPNKLAIMGGSAGGYTTLAALAFTNTFQVGASHYGVSDCCALAEDTHKFESRYLDSLIGPYPQTKATYIARSPLYHADKFKSPVIFFQGKEDKVVPPSQAEEMLTALKEKGIPTALFLFDGEQHGFRQAENRITVLIEQQKFFRMVLKLDGE